VAHSPRKLIIASRQSRLALWQSEFVAERLRRSYPDCDVSILGMTTSGDRILDVSLSKIGGKGLFVKELELALQEGRADLAVHSAKDVPTPLAPDFQLAAIMAREDPRDCLVSNRYATLEQLPDGAVLGTSSLRREAQLRERFPHLDVRPLRGNLDTRLSKLDRGEYDAIVLAAAGLIRLGLPQRIRTVLKPEESLPAPGQGALAIECRAGRADMRDWLSVLDDPQTALCVRAERALSHGLSASCQVPVGAYAVAQGSELHLRGLVAAPDGRQVLRAELSGPKDSPERLGEQVAQALYERGASAILSALR
jgi:hydroxymethylbilane synthase